MTRFRMGGGAREALGLESGFLLGSRGVSVPWGHTCWRYSAPLLVVIKDLSGLAITATA